MASSLAGLVTGASFFVLDIPEPDLAYFSEYSITVPQARGGQARQGFQRAVLFWNELLVPAAAAIKEKIEAAEAVTEPGNGILYVTLPRNDASDRWPGWIDVSGVVIMPEWVPDPARRGLVFPSVTVQLNNVTIENEPSTVV
jgi:hypothetical protein